MQDEIVLQKFYHRTHAPKMSLRYAIVSGVSLVSGALGLLIYQNQTRPREPQLAHPTNTLPPPPHPPSQPTPHLPHRPAQHPQQAPTKDSPAPSSPVGPDALVSTEAREILKYGIPNAENVIVRAGYVVGYDRRTRNAAWAIQRISADQLKGEGTRAESQFKEDPTQPAMFRAKLSDYFQSGFDRGHLVPAGDNKASQQAMDDTFYLTNISPQVGAGFNRNYWARLEQFARDLTKQYLNVYVITGPLWLPHKEGDGKYYVKYQVIGEPPNVAVPTHFFKVILAETNDHNRYIGAFIMENAVIDDKVPLSTFHVPVEQVERSSGLSLFSALERNKMLPLCSHTSCQLPSPDFYKKGRSKSA